MLVHLICCILVIVYITKLYLKFKPFFDLQKRTTHCDWAILKLRNSNNFNFVKEFSKLFKHYDSFWHFKNFTVIAKDPDDLKIVLTSDNVLKRLQHRKYFANGLLVDPSNNKIHRKILSPLFLPSALSRNVSNVNKIMDNFLERYEKKLNGNQVDAANITFDFAIKVVGPTIFGMKSEVDLSETELVKTESKKVSTFLLSRVFKPWLIFEFIYKRTTTAKDINRMRGNIMLKILNCNPEDYFKIENSDPRFFFGLLKKIPMSSEEFFESSTFFLSASTDTTAAVLSSTLLLLAMNQNVQNKLYDELKKSVIESSQDHVSEDQMAKMSYLDLVFKESLRLLPLTYMLRRTVTSPLKLKKYTLPVNTEILIPTLTTHTDKKLWGSDALEFKPERFEKENFKKIHPYAYFPFAAGQKICPGMKYALIIMKIFLSRFLMEYKVSTEMEYTEFDFVIGSSLKIQQPAMITFKKRT